MGSLRKKIGIIIAGFFITIIFLKFVTIPYIWISLLWFSVFIYLTITFKELLTRIISFYISIGILTFGIYEAYLWLKTEKIKKEEGVIINTEDKYYWIRHPILGYAPAKKNKRFIFNIFKDNNFLRSITYTIDSNGLRISPPYKKGASECILVFGGSFTFGEGVSDEETLPYRVGIETNGRYQVYNFGYHGYGPHQMLAAIEHGIVQDIIECTPKYVIYQALFDHVKRSAGLVPWDKHGPKYVLNKNGEVVFKGHFDDNKILLPKRLENQLLKSLIIKKIWLKYFAIKRRPVIDNDIDLFVSIVDKSRNILESKYKECEFHVIFWDYRRDKEYNNLIVKLKKRKLKIHLISDILPDFYTNPSMYSLSDIGNPHPNPLAYRIIAKYMTMSLKNVEVGSDLD